jgi:hypothetical protein
MACLNEPFHKQPQLRKLRMCLVLIQSYFTRTRTCLNTGTMNGDRIRPLLCLKDCLLFLYTTDKTGIVGAKPLPGSRNIRCSGMRPPVFTCH